jgi:hypothetical protein
VAFCGNQIPFSPARKRVTAAARATCSRSRVFFGQSITTVGQQPQDHALPFSADLAQPRMVQAIEAACILLILWHGRS